ncbi:hypothetical protein BGZ93_009234 [Podila epicladia]|nr:hypothetical protein BGZ92_002874 [Podila epicladia]KAG0090585.1 hypothetical protein BGZ93_009234 [Podila epicladia]
MSRPTAESTTAHTGQLHSSTLTLGVNEHQELDWRYLSTTDAYSSEYSSQDEYDDEDDYLQDDIVIPLTPHPPPQGLRTRPLLVPSRSNSGAFPSGSSPSQALSSSHASNGAAEADDSTDTIKSMRARALDKINGRGASTSTRIATNEYAKSPPRGTSSTGPGKTNSSSINSTKRPTTAGSSGTSYSTRPSISSASHQEERASGQSAKLKRRSFGLERSTLPRITTKFDQDGQQTATSVRKRNSGSFKSQQVLLTSEDEGPTENGGNGYQDRARFPTESGGLLLSELKALKARVQELEMERMNRSLSLSVQSSQLTPKSDRPTEDPTASHSEKLQNILQKHRGSTGAAPLRSPIAVARDGSIRASTLSRLQPPNTPKSSPTTQHVALLQEAFKTFEKAISSTGPSSVQAMSNVVQNAINVNQTIRTLIKADVSLVDSSSMSSLQRASDDQIRSLTEALLGMATQAPFDRTMTPSEAKAGPRPYSPRLSMHTRFDQGQRLSLGMVGQELGAPEPYLSRPYSSAAESIGSTPNMISSGHPSRTNSIASTISNDNRKSALRHGYNSDYAENRHRHTGSLGRYPIESASSRESSPPRDSYGAGQGRLPLPGHVQSPRFATSTPRSTQSPRFASPGLDSVGDNDAVVSAQARRQASVRNILARYSQMSPTGPRRDDLEPESQDHGQGHYLEHSSRHQLQPRQSNPRLSESVIISSGGTLGRSSMRPLSQQENHNMRSSMSIQERLGQGRGSIRNTRPNVFSEDEGGWGTVSVGQLDHRSRPVYVHPQHQQEEDQGYPVGYLERSFQAHKGFSDGEVPVTRQQMMQRQRHQQQDMAMTTPSMSSPTSSPSSSSRLEGQSLASSGYGGVDGRYHLSPRGPAHPSAFPRQQSLIGMSNLLEYGNHTGTIGRAMAKTVASLGEHAFHQQHHAEGLSPHAQAQFGHIFAQN